MKIIIESLGPNSQSWALADLVGTILERQEEIEKEVNRRNRDFPDDEMVQVYGSNLFLHFLRIPDGSGRAKRVVKVYESDSDFKPRTNLWVTVKV